MNKEIKKKNREAGRNALIYCYKFLKQTGQKYTYFANHYGMLTNVYDYIHLVHPEWPMTDYRKNIKSLEYMKLGGFKDETIKEAAKCKAAEEMIYRLVEQRYKIEDI